MKLFSLIKKGDVHLSGKNKIIPKDEFQTLADAEEILEQTQSDIESLMEETKKICEEMKIEAKKQGMQEGLALFNQQLMHLNDQMNFLTSEMQQQILPLALKAAKKIVGEELKTNPDTIVNIVLQTIKPVLSAKNIRILVSKEDLKHLQQQKDLLKHHFERLEHFTVEERADIQPGSCVIETEAGIINATLENQWRALEAAFEKFSKKK